MKNLILISIVFAGLLFAQKIEKITTVSTTGAENDTITIKVNYNTYGYFDGYLNLGLNVDNIDGAADSVQYIIRVPWAGGYVQETITWNRVEDLSNFTNTHTWIMPQTADSTYLFGWSNDPSSNLGILGYNWDEVQIIKVYKNASSFTEKFYWYR